MSHWARDPEAAADALIERSLGAIALGGRVLAANQAGGLPARLVKHDIACTVWNRRMTGNGPARPWPPAGPFDVALLRLPKAKDEQEMAAHACLGALGRTGRLIVYGGNDEGIRSAGRLLEAVCGTVETVAAHSHGRILAAHRPDDISRVRGSLGAWRSVSRLQIGGSVRDWVSYPGLFAADRIDEGTALLIGALPPLDAEAHVLDYGCGAGVIAAAALAQAPGIVLDLMDNDTVALEAARENVPGASLMLGDSLAEATARYHAILSNPPLHLGFAQTRAPLEHLIAEAPRRLHAGGCLQIVVQRRVPLDRDLSRHFSAVSIVDESARYRVWRASVS
jgi:16S rRNA (guanine1207-N2)-methyltransferase